MLKDNFILQIKSSIREHRVSPSINNYHAPYTPNSIYKKKKIAHVKGTPDTSKQLINF